MTSSSQNPAISGLQLGPSVLTHGLPPAQTLELQLSLRDPEAHWPSLDPKRMPAMPPFLCSSFQQNSSGSCLY